MSGRLPCSAHGCRQQKVKRLHGGGQAFGRDEEEAQSCGGVMMGAVPLGSCSRRVCGRVDGLVVERERRGCWLRGFGSDVYCPCVPEYARSSFEQHNVCSASESPVMRGSTGKMRQSNLQGCGGGPQDSKDAVCGEGQSANFWSCFYFGLPPGSRGRLGEMLSTGCAGEDCDCDDMSRTLRRSERRAQCAWRSM